MLREEARGRAGRSVARLGYGMLAGLIVLALGLLGAPLASAEVDATATEAPVTETPVASEEPAATRSAQPSIPADPSDDGSSGESSAGDADDAKATADADGDDSTGDDSTGDDSTGGDTTGGDSTGGDSTGDDSTGDDSTGDDSTGDDSTGDSTGDDSAGDGDEPPATVPSTAFTVEDAMFRWGINNESNNRGAAPGTFNFFSAGKIGNPGAGEQQLTDASSGGLWSNGARAGWSPESGNVRIEKAQPNGSYALATWAGTKTDRQGNTLGNYATNTSFSDHQVVIRGGTGTVDPAAGSATIKWSGSFTIIYYSGYSFFYVSDPVLTVTNGIGRITGTLGGYASSRGNMSQWAPVPDQPGIVLAELGAVDLTKDLGFVAKPAYLGVRVTGVDQVNSGAWAGSFPQSFIDFTNSISLAEFWFSSGGGVDRNKVPLELAVSYSAAKPVVASVEPDARWRDAKVRNSAPPPPTAPTGPAGPTAPVGTPPVAPVFPVQPPGPALPEQTVVPAPAALSGAGLDFVASDVRPVATVLPATLRPVSAEVSDGWSAWTLGFGLLALAALALVSPAFYRLALAVQRPRSVRSTPTK